MLTAETIAALVVLIRQMHMSSEVAPDVRAFPMRLVRQDAFDAVLAAAAAIEASNGAKP